MGVDYIIKCEFHSVEVTPKKTNKQTNKRAVKENKQNKAKTTMALHC